MQFSLGARTNQLTAIWSYSRPALDTVDELLRRRQTMGHQVEVLQSSSLEDYDWPENDPHAVPQRTRTMTEGDIRLIRLCLQSAEINLEAFLKDKRTLIQSHCCPATSRTDSTGCKYHLSRYRSPSPEVPVKWGFSRIELG